MGPYSVPSSKNSERGKVYFCSRMFSLTFRFLGDLLEMNRDRFVQTVREISLH